MKHLAILFAALCLSFSPAARAADAFSTNDVSAPASNTAAVITYAASSAAANVGHVVQGIVWSYSGGTPTGGNLKIENGSGVTVFSLDITSAGAGFIPFPLPKKGSGATALIITLAAGGSGVSGKVNVLYHSLE